MIGLLILVIVDAHDAATPLPGALARAAEEALGPDVAVSTQTITDSSAAATLEAGRAARAAFVAEVTWSDERRTKAHLAVAAVDGSLSRSSTISFDAADPLAERGRALGLVLAALVAPEQQPRPASDREAGPRAPPAAAVLAMASPPSPRASPRRFELDAAVGGGMALGGSGSGVGGALGLRWHPGKRIGLRAGAQARFGEVPSAQAAARDYAVSAGVALSVLAPRDERRFALALRLEGLLLYQSLSHLSDDDVSPVRRARLLPGATALAEGQWAISPTLALALGAGGEIVFGTTDVFVRQQKVAELAPVRLVVQGGLVARF
jgi:hypothetical protein